MKIATAILVAAAAVCVSQVDAFLIDAVKENVEKLGNSVNDNLKKATEALQGGLEEAKAQAEQATEKLQEAAEKVGDKVQGVVDNVQESVDKEVNELTEKVETEGVDVSECKQALQSVPEAAKTIVNNTVSCITSTIKNAKDAVTNAVSVAVNTLKEIQDLRKKSEECSANAGEGIMARISTSGCLTTVNTKTVFVVSTGVPSVIKNILSATKQIVALPPTLTSCLSKTAVKALTEQSRIVVDNVKQCIAEKTGKKQEKQESVVEEKKSEENKEEAAANNPISWRKLKIL